MGVFDPYVVPDESELYFFSNRESDDYDIYRATNIGTSYGSPAPVTEVNSSAVDGNPVPRADNLALYFFSQRDGAPGNIHVARRNTTSEPFGVPQLVAELNSDHQDRPGWVAPDGYPSFATWGPDGPAGDSIVRALLLGRNKDKGGGWYDATSTARPDTWTESMWIGYSKVWVSDPGWPLWPAVTPGKTVDHQH